MSLQIIHPKNEEHWLELRTQDITSTEISALYGCSPYATEYEVWHRKRDNTIIDFQMNERVKWGTRLEAAIARGVAEEHSLTIRPMKEYIRDPDIRIGSSFDFAILDTGILEVKNVDSLVFLKTWTEDENGHIEAPPHIEFQVQHQLAVSGRQFVYLGVLVGGNRLVMIKRSRNEPVIESIKKKVTAFWKSIKNNNEPKPDLEKDAEFISKLYSFAEPGKIMDAKQDVELFDLAEKYKKYGDNEREAKRKKDGIKAEILMKINDSEKVLGDKYTISAGITGPSEVSYTRKAYRNFRISWKGKKK